MSDEDFIAELDLPSTFPQLGQPKNPKQTKEQETHMSKHTPGPWIAVHYYDEEVTITDSRGFEHVSAESVAILFDYQGKLGISHWADSPDASREISVEEQNANAHLIAAAPDLLEGAEALVESIEKLIAAGELSDRALEAMLLQPITHAIAKARGDV